MEMQSGNCKYRRKEGEVMQDDTAGVTPLLIGAPMQGVRHE